MLSETVKNVITHLKVIYINRIMKKGECAMKGVVTGVRPVHFPDEKTGEFVDGKRIFVMHEDVDCFGKVFSVVWVGSGTPLEKKLAGYLTDPNKIVDCEVEFSFKQGSKKVSQFDVIGKPENKAG